MQESAACGNVPLASFNYLHSHASWVPPEDVLTEYRAAKGHGPP